MIKLQSKPDSITSRYQEAYAEALGVVRFGRIIKDVGPFFIIVIPILGLMAQNWRIFLGTLIIGAMIWSLAFGIGVAIMAQGQGMLAVLDTAVNTSPLLDFEQKRGLIVGIEPSPGPADRSEDSKGAVE